MKLFDEAERTSNKAAGYSEPHFDYLNLSNRPVASQIRQILEDWFTHYPEEEKVEFRQKFRSSINMQHKAAFFELFLHELFTTLGYNIVLHPEIDNKIRTRPDFLLTKPNSVQLIVEAITASSESQDGTIAQAIIDDLLDNINQHLSSPNFFVGVSISGRAKTLPSSRKIAAFLGDVPHLT